MRVLADGQALQNSVTVERGIGRYVTELARAIERDRPDAISSWVLRPELPLPTHLPELVWADRIALRDDPDLPSPDIWHVLSPFESLEQGPEAIWPLWARGPRTRLVTTLYDLIPLVFPERYLRDAAVRRRYQLRLQIIEHSDRVLAISEATANDAVRLLGISPGRIDVVGAGVGEIFVPPASHDAAQTQALGMLAGLRPGFVMYTGGIDFRKNIDSLLVAYSLLPRALRHEHQLVIVCRMLDSERRDLERRAQQLDVEGDVLLTGYVPDITLTVLYQAAHLFVFPSLYEGFGLPVVEAIASGAAVIVGANSSLVELVPDRRAHFDAGDPDSIACCLRDVLTHNELRMNLKRAADASPHRWSLVAERTVAAYAATMRGHRPPERQPRLWFVSPMPPVASGVADYSWSLLRELATWATIDAFTFDATTMPEIPGVRWHAYSNADAVEALFGRPDARVLAMGNSEYHIEVLRLLRAYGGIVMAHDVRFTGLLAAAAREAPELVDQATQEALASIAAGERPRVHRDHVAASPSEYYTLNGLLTAPALAGADRIAVHSRSAAALARANLPPDLRERVAVIPFGHKLRDPRPDTTRDAVISLGAVHWSKESGTVCRAFVKLAGMYPDMMFAIVGKFVDEADRGVFDTLVAEAGVADRVVVTGWVEPGDYDAWISRARLAVQLRALTNGETSAAVADCFGAAVPVVTTSIGAAMDLEGICALVVPGIDADDLVDVVGPLLSDEDQLALMARRGREHAEAATFPQVSDAIRRLVARTAGPVGVGVEVPTDAAPR